MRARCAIPRHGRTPNGGTDEGSGAKYDMKTFDEVLVKRSIDFMKKAKETASRSSSGTTPRACTCGPSCPRSTRR